MTQSLNVPHTVSVGPGAGGPLSEPRQRSNARSAGSVSREIRSSLPAVQIRCSTTVPIAELTSVANPGSTRCASEAPSNRVGLMETH